MSSFSETFHRLLTAPGQSRSAKTVEVFGWLILLEGTLVVLLPHLVAQILHLPPLVEQAANYFRLVGLLVSGVGILYIASGRLNAAGFVFASLLDRPLVPFAMAILWYLQIISRILGADLFASRFWQLSVDPYSLACRVTGSTLKGFLILGDDDQFSET
jgi:hypothetical protein